ncbi:hypothetical protein [Saezia sanguinis]|uniref:hypothetical protein n=1 Tax=Saezia sanguinis TaxID=1965230 RepID=UPI003055AC38
MASYITAFFCLSIGLERMSKLILVADYWIKNGSYPNNRFLKDTYSHDIARLLDACEKLPSSVERPNSEIHHGITTTLSEFGKKTRYYNLDLICASPSGQPEPITIWWERVAKPILEKHYGNRKRQQHENIAQHVAQGMQPSIMAPFFAEDGSEIDSIETLEFHYLETRVVQKYSSFYTYQIVRWLAYLIADYSHKVNDMQEINEYFCLLQNDDDSYIKRRKAWLTL